MFCDSLFACDSMLQKCEEGMLRRMACVVACVVAKSAKKGRRDAEDAEDAEACVVASMITLPLVVA